MTYKAFGAISLCVILLTGCATSSKRTDNLDKKVLVYNSISGRIGSDGPVLVVKIDDTRQAHPQIGLEGADIVYIEQVEGGLTRLAAIFSSIIPTRIGPVRSARISDLELLSQYGHVVFAYSGAQSKLRPEISNANLQGLGAESQPPSIYTTDPNRNQPYAMVLRADLLMQKVAEKGYAIAQSKNMGWNFGPAPAQGSSIISAKISWPATSYTVVWSASQSRWLLSHDGLSDVAESGKVLGATTFVIQKVQITDSQYRDKIGGITPFSATVGNGTGFILRGGKSFAASWSRPTADSLTRWSSADGSEIKFARGQIWVALIDKDPEFTLKKVSAPPSPTK